MSDRFGWLRCPRCRGPFEERSLGAHEALLECDCARYPVLEDIPILLDSPDVRRTVRLLDEGRVDEALGVMLAPVPKTGRAAKWLRRLIQLAGQRVKAIFERKQALAVAQELESRLSAREVLSFFFLESGWAYPETFNYFFHRRSDPTYLTARSLLPVVAEAPGKVLDIGCGVGHLASELISRVGVGRVVAMDAMFPLLYVARRFVVPDAQLVCASAERSLPFDDAYFGSVWYCDGLHDVKEMAGCAREIERVTADDGVAVLPHAHNAAGNHQYRGPNPVSPEVYARLFDAVRIYDEARFLDPALQAAMIDLSMDPNRDEIATAKDLVLVASKNPEVFRRYAAAPVQKPRRPRFSPLLKWTRIDGGLRLVRQLPSQAYQEEFPALERTLPEQMSLPSDALSRCARGDPKAQSWLRRGIVLDLPPDYD